MKKYLDDKAIDKASDDKFGHLNLAKQIGEIIAEQTADHPVNIGLFGKWGVGKSSVVELLEKNVLADEIGNNEIKFIRVNVWKYHSVSSIRNKIFYQIAKTLDVENNVRRLYENSTTTSSSVDYQSFLKKFFEGRFSKDRFENIAIFLIVFAACILLLICVYNLSPAAGFVANSIFTIIASWTFIRIAVDYFMKTFVSSTAVVSKPFESEEQFEHAVIELFNHDDFKGLKKILFIDDLDRCSSDKVLLTLETIKTFLQISNCVFIVACDQDMVKKAVIDSNKDFKYSDKDGANYLEKFFQHFIYLPPYLPTNLRNYTKNIIIEAGLSILDTLDNKQLDTVIYILAYKDIINPRKIKVLLNSFIFDYYSILEKETDQGHPLQPGFITQHPERLAILTVLKIDFPLFVNDLTIEPTLASKIAYRDTGVDQDKFRERYFGTISTEHKEYHAQLEAYLFLVKDWIPRDFTPYLFVSLETTGFNELPSIEHVRFVQLIRDGDTNLMAALEKLNGAERLKACAAIGTLQESLTNTVERKNATAAFTHVADAYPNIGEYINAPEVLYSFKSNYENGFAKDAAAQGINGWGLANLIIYAFDSGFEAQGRSLLDLTQKRLTGPASYLFFLLPFLYKKRYSTIKSAKLKTSLKESVESELSTALGAGNHISLIADIMGPGEIESTVFEDNFKSMAIGMAKISVGEYRKIAEADKVTYDISSYEGVLTRMIDGGMDQLVVDFLRKLKESDRMLFRYYVIMLNKLFSRSKAATGFFFSIDAEEEYEEEDEKYIVALLSIAKRSIISRTENAGPLINDNVFPLFTEANTFLRRYDSQGINSLMEECYDNVLRTSEISKSDKANFVAEMIMKTPLVVREEPNLVMLLKRANILFRTQVVFDAVTTKFVDSIFAGKEPGIKSFEAFFKAFQALVDLHSEIFSKDIVAKLFSINKAEGAPLTAGILKRLISNLKKPVDLCYVLTAMGKETGVEYTRYCLEVLTANTKLSKPTGTLIADLLPKHLTRMTPATAEKKSTWVYPVSIRAMMIEALLVHSQFGFGDNLLNNLISLGVNAGQLKSGRKIAAKLISAQNKGGAKDDFRMQTALTQISAAIAGLGGEHIHVFVDYLENTVSRILEKNGSRKKSELQTAFLTVQENFKHYSASIDKATKVKLVSIMQTALDSNPNLGARVTKIKKIFKL